MERWLENLDITDTQGLENWHERFNFLRLPMIGKEAYKLLKDLAYPENLDVHSVKELQALLKVHLQPVNFESIKRARFYNLARRSEEPLT